jgi:hypothetical protein
MGGGEGVSGVWKDIDDLLEKGGEPHCLAVTTTNRE